MDGCEETLIIPQELTDDSGKTKKVEAIGQFAFNACGDKDVTNGITCSNVLSKYIKVVKTYGLGWMIDVTSFEIEVGSCLERIEYLGLAHMSYENKSESDRSCILELPSTVTSIAEHGLDWNNLIKTIYYCDSTNLSNYSALVNRVSNPDIKVTSSYTYPKIFRDYTPKKDSSCIAEAEGICDKYKPEASPPPLTLRKLRSN